MNCDSVRRDHMAEQYLPARNKRPREGPFIFWRWSESSVDYALPVP